MKIENVSEIIFHRERDIKSRITYSRIHLEIMFAKA